MTKKEIELRKKAAESLAKAKAINALAEKEDREITKEEDQQISGFLAECENCRKSANRVHEIARHTDSLSGSESPIVPPSSRPPQSDDDNEPQRLPATPAVPRDVVTEGRFGWSHVGEFAQAVVQATTPDIASFDNRLNASAAASGANQAVGSQGGFLVPPTFSSVIWDGLNDGSENLLGLTDQYTVEGESLTFPANAETSRATGSRYGGVRGYWLNEADQITSSAPKFRQVKLQPQEIAALVYATNKLLRNSPVALEQYLSRACSEELNFLIGDSIVNGDGTGKPLGILSSGCLVSVAKESGQAAATVMSENIVKMWARCHARSRANAVWLVNQDIEPQLHQMTIGVGTSGLPTYLPPGGLSATPYGMLMGRPVVPVEYCQTLGTVGDIVLADLKGYATGVQGGIDTAMSIHLRFDYAESCFRFMTAVDGQPWLASALTPFKGSKTLSPFVALATRS